MDTIISFFKEFASMLPTVKFMDIVDILLVAFVIYTIIMMIQNTGAVRIAKSVIILSSCTSS